MGLLRMPVSIVCTHKMCDAFAFTSITKWWQNFWDGAVQRPLFLSSGQPCRRPPCECCRARRKFRGQRCCVQELALSGFFVLSAARPTGTPEQCGTVWVVCVHQKLRPGFVLTRKTPGGFRAGVLGMGFGAKRQKIFGKCFETARFSVLEG